MSGDDLAIFAAGRRGLRLWAIAHTRAVARHGVLVRMQRSRSDHTKYTSKPERKGERYAVVVLKT